MNESEYTVSGMAVVEMLNGDGHFLPAEEILTDLTDEQATAVPPGARYSIAQIVNHLHFYQAAEIAAIRGEKHPRPKHLEDTFEAIAPQQWPDLRTAFLGDLAACRRLASDPTWNGRASEVNDGATVGYDLLGTALHNAYHLGQIVTLRQVLGCWPPPPGEFYDF